MKIAHVKDTPEEEAEKDIESREAEEEKKAIEEPLREQIRTKLMEYARSGLLLTGKRGKANKNLSHL